MKSKIGGSGPISETQARLTFGSVAVRPILASGIEFETLLYDCPELQDVRESKRFKQVFIYCGDWDLSTITVIAGSEAFDVPCLTSGLNGVSRRHWSLTQSDQLRKCGAEAEAHTETRDASLQACADTVVIALERAGLKSPRMSEEETKAASDERRQIKRIVGNPGTVLMTEKTRSIAATASAKKKRSESQRNNDSDFNNIDKWGDPE